MQVVRVTVYYYYYYYYYYVKQEHGDRMNSALRRSGVICDVTPCRLSYIPDDCANSHRPQHHKSFVLLIY